MLLTMVSIVCGFLSAGAWLKASVVKVSREQEIKWRTKKANKMGEKPNLAGATLDGWDMSGTFRAQAKWNAIAAVLAAISLSCQALAQML